MINEVEKATEREKERRENGKINEKWMNEIFEIFFCRVSNHGKVNESSTKV
jgi:hypothetical protein